MGCRVVVLVSGDGSLLQSLLDATARPGHPAQVVAVVSDRPAVRALERAVLAGVPTEVVRPQDHLDRTAWDTALTQATAAHRPDLVVLAGFNRLVGTGFLARFGGRVLNSHPALLPAFPGLHAVRDALAHGVKVTGATLFVVDAGTDTGPIVAQVAVPVAEDDTELTLHERIKQAERVMLPDQVGRLAGQGFSIDGRKVVVAMTADQAAPDRAAPDQAGPQQDTGELRPVRRALLSVYDKAGLEELALGLSAAGVTLVSTGSTAARIAAAGVPVTRVEELTGFPESLDGRVKTLHPRVHAGLLADTRRPEHLRQLGELGIEGFDLLVGNLYPFSDTVASGAAPEDCIEQIDIGGPAMVRSAAKNHASVAVVVDPARYGDVLAAVRAGGTTLSQRQALAAVAFRHTAGYDTAVAAWMAGQFLGDDSGFPGWVAVTATHAAGLRYGENPHQPAALYARDDTPAGIAQAEQLHGKEMSYNNYVDADAAVRAAWDFAEPCVAIVKHTNPCGLAVASPGAADPVADAHARALACDPVSAFGGVVAVNRTVTVAAAEQIAQVFTEVVVAPDFERAAVEALSRKRSVRLLRLPPGFALPRHDLRTVSGGLLVQLADRFDAPGDDPGAWTLAAGSVVDAATMSDLVFAWRACRSVHSNAILLADAGATVGIGMGQVNRVDSARLAVTRAGGRAAGSVAAGDAFFPFADGLKVLLDAGVRAVVQPGGSMRDPEVVAAAESAGVSMYLTGARHFRH